EGPRGFLHAGEYDAFLEMRRLLFRPYIPIAVFRFRVASRFLEPRVFIGGVINDQIDQDSHAPLLRAVSEFDEIAERPEAPIDVVVIGYVITSIAIGRRLEWHQPDCRDAQAMQIIEPACKALEIADAVSVRIHERLDGEAINDRVLVPEV